MPTLEEALDQLDRIEIVIPPEADRHRTFARVAAVYDNRKVELTQEGHIIVMAPAGMEGGYLSGEVYRQLANWAVEMGTGKAFDSSAGFYITPEQNRSPDAAWVSNERIRNIPKKDRQRFAPFCPDFAIEVKSPSNSLPELRAKCRSYIENGAFEAWLIVPDDQSVQVFSTASSPVLSRRDLLIKQAEMKGSGPLEGFILDLTPIWAGL